MAPDDMSLNWPPGIKRQTMPWTHAHRAERLGGLAPTPAIDGGGLEGGFRCGEGSMLMGKQDRQDGW